MSTREFAPLGSFRPAADLWTRLNRNFGRLEEKKYWPENVYQRVKEAKRWPGDTEGRTVLAWVLLAQAAGRPPRYLDAMLARWPDEVNEAGYYGTIHSGAISEQQLSGHGWMLQALGELEKWRPDAGARELALPIIENLFLPTAGRYGEYTIDPNEREAAGEYAGSHLKQVGPWILSTDVGCFAIGMTGLIETCAAFGLEGAVPALIDEMLERFLAIDLDAIQAQTHATLTACRGMLRWSRLRDRPELVDEAARRYQLYLDLAWTETHANFNWFGRPQWTEPCAVVDSLMVALELWRLRGGSALLEQAQLAWFNALGHGQRANGGFGCDNCPGADGEETLFYKTEESHWCCTMRGSEGLARMCQFNITLDAGTIRLPFGLPGEFVRDGQRLRIETAYPRAARWAITNLGNEAVGVSLFLPSWIENHERDDEGWISRPVAPGEAWSLEATLRQGFREVLPATARFNPQMAVRRVRFDGPLLLGQYGEEWRPIADDYLRGNMEKAHSAKTLLIGGDAARP